MNKSMTNNIRRDALLVEEQRSSTPELHPTCMATYGQPPSLRQQVCTVQAVSSAVATVLLQLLLQQSRQPAIQPISTELLSLPLQAQAV